MHIKQIIIQGFKSYKEQTVIEPFSARHNVVVGRNGSGKSNFFAAIRFVLSDAYTHMSREERQSLLHEGSGTAVMSAYVEIIFDNSDNRFPTGRDEVVLRRTIGLKKDEYSLDRKTASKSDVMNLLESAGFSRSNPYYIVPQGRITSLTNAKDHERLQLLKEVAGTQVYEQRRSESLKIMEETESKRQKIDELLKYIEERLSELEEEKEELRGFQEKDRERRCLEYTIYVREQQEVNLALEELEEDRANNVNANEDRREIFIEREQRIQELEGEIAGVRQRLNALSVEKEQLDEEKREAVRKRAQLEIAVNELQEGREGADERREQHAQELSEIEAEIETAEAELSDLLPQYSEAKGAETEAKSRLDEVDGELQRLYAKQGRNAQFSNKRERDQWLNTEIQEVQSTLARRTEQEQTLASDVDDLRRQCDEVAASIKSLRQQLDGRKDNMAKLRKDVEEAKNVRAELDDRRKELWREDARLGDVVSNARSEMEKAERNLNHAMDRNTSLGLASVRRIIANNSIPGVYGPLCDLFEVEDRYKTSVEVAAGASLFHVVVDTDTTASRVLEVLNREKAGRLTFMPLNRLRNKPANYPEGANDAIPMIKKLKFDEKYSQAFRQVFGKTIICPNLDVASQYARSHQLNAITLGGDRSDKKGALTGGYHDTRRSRLESVKNIRKWRAVLDAESVRANEVRKELERLEQEITQALSNIQITDAKLRAAEDSYGPMRNELSTKTRNGSALNEALVKKEQSHANAKSDLAHLNSRLESLQAELRTAFTSTLTAAEQRKLAELTGQVDEAKSAYTEAAGRRTELETKKNIVDDKLRTNLYLRRDELNELVSEDVDPAGQGGLDAQQAELKKADAVVSELADKSDELEAQIEEAKTELNDREAEKGQLQQQQTEDARAIEKQLKGMEKNMSKRTMLLQKKGECNRNIRDLGVLPDEAFEKYTKIKSEVIVKRLHKVNEALKKYGHVNKKAFEQYNNFTKQRDQLMKRREELDGSQESIEELIAHLDQRKDEAIERTFRQVSKAFSEVFEKLVPAGRGRLIMQRKVDRPQDDDDESDDEETQRAKSSVENYIGVAIAVSFNSKGDEQLRIQQLSGGQKSLCALALIFAIQQCDPAPFYLFDEIDANLDAQYRTAVAAMLHEMSEHGQFICTTFRPEMIEVGDKFYGVTFNNKVSGVSVITRDDARSFIEGASS
ncbi:chromosome scaffold protein [Saitoella complicata NRRL Y-17804]|uniref:Structural maintenance of chromosomes protein n=1 Tax=Saitoella complicata (strain BCRC 22490 / CBS 7301 / JCM 7358 / NBRC 10748 / NRRL Y-17804) TaxID=698492 RepID=A0A0E9NNE6_SAICN|nr:chromosome scaffold protein [Saitoella complicata NRRL Y-17804]ODQ53745.1 chromosome scaffold protein [Saitoella complicata NRRL Y-17804]GAO50930.1 hypothetical protein G7K_5049-t1 [Saitoella complicata NRRL Y-17804]